MISKRRAFVVDLDGDARRGRLCDDRVTIRDGVGSLENLGNEATASWNSNSVFEFKLLAPTWNSS